MTSQLPHRLLTILLLVFAIATISIVGGRAYYESSSTSQRARVSARAETQASATDKSLSNPRRPGPIRSFEAERSSAPFGFGGGASFSPMGMFVPNVAATKTAVLGTDVNGNGFVNPGDTLTYSVVVANTGTDATNVVFTDQLNGDLTLIGAAIASPIATNDAYAVLGNVGITVPAGSGLLVNDVNPISDQELGGSA